MANISTKQLVQAAVERDVELSGALSHGLTEISEGLAKTSALQSFLRNPSVDLEDKKRALETAFSGVAAQARHTVLAFIRRGLAEELESGLAEIRAAALERSGKIAVNVQSAAELDEGQKQRIAAAAKAKFGKDAELHATVDPDLIGGARIKAGDTQFDGTIKGRLDQLTKRIAKLR